MPADANAALESETGNERDLRASVADGACTSAMVGLGETYVPAFALAVGMGEVVAGLIATVPMMIGAVLQLATPWAVRRLGSYRSWVRACALLQAMSFVPLAVGAARGVLPLWWLVASMAAYWAFGMAASPAWNAWITALVPVPIRARFFARRTLIGQGTLLVAMLAAGLLLERGRVLGDVGSVFAWLFCAALVARLGSALFLSRHSEPAGLSNEHREAPRAGLMTAIRGAGAGRALAYLVSMQFVVNIAGPFFTPFMFGPLGMSYAEFIILTATAFVTRVLVLPGLGRLAHARGTRPLLWLGACGIVPIPALWTVSHDYGYLLLLQVLSGSAWAALELAMVLVFFDGIRPSDRTRVLTAFNLANALAMGSGAIAGSLLFTAFDDGAAAYWWLFVLSTAGRLLILFVLQAPRSRRRPGFVTLRSVAVRPSAGAIGRPLVGSLDAEDGTDGDSDREQVHSLV